MLRQQYGLAIALCKESNQDINHKETIMNMNDIGPFHLLNQYGDTKWINKGKGNPNLLSVIFQMGIPMSSG